MCQVGAVWADWMSEKPTEAIQVNDEILTVDKYCREDDGEVCVKCPHCGWVIGLQRGPFKGEQYKHTANKDCSGWLEVSHDARLVKTSDELAPAA